MKLRQSQGGMSLLGMLVIALMAGFFVMCAIKLAPGYFEYLSVKEIMSTVAREHNPREETIADIRRRIAALLNTNQVYGIKARDVDIYRKEGQTFIDASYESRVPIVWRIDAVMRFDDLKYEAGGSQSR